MEEISADPSVLSPWQRPSSAPSKQSGSRTEGKSPGGRGQGRGRGRSPSPGRGREQARGAAQGGRGAGRGSNADSRGGNGQRGVPSTRTRSGVAKGMKLSSERSMRGEPGLGPMEATRRKAEKSAAQGLAANEGGRKKEPGAFLSAQQLSLLQRQRAFREYIMRKKLEDS